MRSIDAILKMVSERHHQHKKNGLYVLKGNDQFRYDVNASLAAFYVLPYQYSDILIKSELFPSLYTDHLKVKNKLGLTRKEQLLQAAAIIVAEIERIELDQENALCFLKYLP